MPRIHLLRSRPGTGGFITSGALIVAAASALVVLLMSACHSTPPATGLAAGGAGTAAAPAPKQAEAMAPLQPFDEHFYVATAADE